MKTMPAVLRLCLPAKVNGITLPPFGIYARPGEEANLNLAKHEQVHWLQYQRMGLVRFYAVYLWQLARYGYEQHPMELEARERSAGKPAPPVA